MAVDKKTLIILAPLVVGTMVIGAVCTYSFLFLFATYPPIIATLGILPIGFGSAWLLNKIIKRGITKPS